MITGLIGKPNVGKTTFFVAATMKEAEIADFPFTTIEPNIGIAYLKTRCVCREFNVKDNPRNSICLNGKRMIPVKLVDVAGLVEGASTGRGKGNKFLDEIRQADAIIHVVDASGTTDAEGRHVTEPISDPVSDIIMVEKEFDLWLAGIISKDIDKLIRLAQQGKDFVELLAQKLSGLSIRKEHIELALTELKISPKNPRLSSDDLASLSTALRKLSKPSIIAANKSDISSSFKNIERIRKTGRVVVPCSAEAELLLRKAARAGLIEYEPGAGSFRIIDESRLNQAQKRALEDVKKRVLDVFGSTGVQDVINKAYFDLLGCVVVFPVEDEKKLTDSQGNVLPDAYVMKRGSTARDLAFAVHTELGEKFAFAIDVRTGMRLGSDYTLKNMDVIKIVSY